MAESEGKIGLVAAVDLLMRRDPEGTAQRTAEQLALLPTPAAIADSLGDEQAAERRGPGRPPGSRNRSTNEWVEFIGSRYRSPLLFLAETYSRPVELLAAELGCLREEAFKHQVRAAEALAPYMHQKQPVAVQVDGRGVVSLVIQTGLPGDQAAPVPIDVAGVVIEGELVDPEHDDKSKA